MKLRLTHIAISAAVAALALQAHAQGSDDIDFGDDSSLWSQDGECDDPRFEGPGMSEVLDDEDTLADATDCRAAFQSGSVSLKALSVAKAPLLNKMPTRKAAGSTDASDVDYGDDESLWANDSECDDARFIGEGMTDTGLTESDIGHDASDCRAGVEAGALRLRGPDDPAIESVLDEYDVAQLLDALEALGAVDAADYDEPPADGIMFNGVNFGDNSSEWANDDECDDPRFTGDGMTSTALLAGDAYHDADDCLASWKAGNLSLAD